MMLHPQIQQLREGVWLMIMHILLIVVLFVVAVPLDVKLVNIYVRATRLLVISREANTV